jgi:hypothetical protein
MSAQQLQQGLVGFSFWWLIVESNQLPVTNQVPSASVCCFRTFSKARVTAI